MILQRIHFSEPNPSNVFLSLLVLDKDQQKEKIEAVWRYLSGDGDNSELSFNGELSAELLKKIFPKVDDQDSKKLLPYINRYLSEYGINSCEERIHFFAQIAEETGQMENVSELASDYASSKSTYKGRGLLQLTGWEYNYKPFEAYCRSLEDNVDFENHPEEVALNPKYAVLSAFWYWKIEKNCSQYCTNLTEESLLKISKLVNCGNINFCGYKKNTITDKKEKCYDCKPNGWDERKKEFERLKKYFLVSKMKLKI